MKERKSSGKNRDARVLSHGAAQSGVGGEQLPTRVLGERHVTGVVRGEVPAKLEDARKQPLVPVPAEREISIVFESGRSALLLQHTSDHPATEPRSDLDVTQSRDVKICIDSPEDAADPASGIRAEQILEESGSIDDDDSQRPSRAARSSRTRSAALRRSLMEGLDSIRSNTSVAGGLATSRSKRSWMYSVSACPRAFARLTNSR
jgi:hypothetical protein